MELLPVPIGRRQFFYVKNSICEGNSVDAMLRVRVAYEWGDIRLRNAKVGPFKGDELSDNFKKNIKKTKKE